MVEKYCTIETGAQGEIVEKKSRFIAYVELVETEEEAYAFIEKIKKKHYDARHNCFAFSVGTEQTLCRFSDDGEPQGTAGKPILEVITGSGVHNICIVVTRYFGGTLLGTGGLVRAYQESAKQALSQCTLVEKILVQRLCIVTDYTDMGKLQYLLGNEKIVIDNILYRDVVEMIAFIPLVKVSYIKKQITEATGARAVLREDDCFYYPQNLSKEL